MLFQIQMLWEVARGNWRIARQRADESGSVVETVVLTAVFAALAIAVGAIIVAKVTAKAHSINLDGN
ncbi:MAG: hypothetical protein WAM97_06035 [Acidimicrobiales bacterium]|jgi:hypothetical protein